MWFNKPSERCSKHDRHSEVLCIFIGATRLVAQEFAAILHRSPLFCSESKVQNRSFSILHQKISIHSLNSQLLLSFPLVRTGKRTAHFSHPQNPPGIQTTLRSLVVCIKKPPENISAFRWWVTAICSYFLIRLTVPATLHSYTRLCAHDPEIPGNLYGGSL